MKIIAITQARIGSSRLPAKVLKEIDGKSLLQIHIERASKARLIDKLIVATTIEPDAIAICELCNKLSVAYYQGSTNDVLDRFYQVCLIEKPDYIVRITSDCPLIDPVVIDAVIEPCIKGGCDYASNTIYPTFPDGIDVEVFSFTALQKAWHQAKLPSEREHVTPFIWKNAQHHNGQMFKSFSLAMQQNFSHYRLTVDDPQDFELIKELVENKGSSLPWMNYVEYMKQHPWLFEINGATKRNEGYSKSIQTDNK